MLFRGRQIFLDLRVNKNRIEKLVYALKFVHKNTFETVSITTYLDLKNVP